MLEVKFVMSKSKINDISLVNTFKVAGCVFAALFLIACGPNLEDAKKLGFESLEEMKDLQAQGYPTKNDFDMRYKKFGFDTPEEMQLVQTRGYATKEIYKSVKALTPQKFNEICMKETPENYKSQCLGKQVSWLGRVESVSNSFGVNIRVLNDDGTVPDSSFTVDIKSLLSSVSLGDKGKLIEFDGRIAKRNVISPDVESIGYARLENSSEMVERLKRVVSEESDTSSNSGTLAEKYVKDEIDRQTKDEPKEAIKSGGLDVQCWNKDVTFTTHLGVFYKGNKYPKDLYMESWARPYTRKGDIISFVEAGLKHELHLDTESLFINFSHGVEKRKCTFFGDSKNI